MNPNQFLFLCIVVAIVGIVTNVTAMFRLRELERREALFRAWLQTERDRWLPNGDKREYDPFMDYADPSVKDASRPSRWGTTGQP